MVKSRPNPKKKGRGASDGVAILASRYLQGDPEMARMVEMERANMDVAAKICALREKAGLSQRALAKLVGTTASVICRLEDADYEGHSLAMLNRIAAALDSRVDIQFVPLKSTRQHAFEGKR